MDNVEPKAEDRRFDGLTIVKSRKYKPWADLLTVELENGVLYSEDEIKQIIDKALKRPVEKKVNA